jgi:hypothetical protein
MITPMNFKEAKQTIRDYFRTAYSDEQLAELLDYTRAGKLRFMSCCCVAGFVTRAEGMAPLEPDQSMNYHSNGEFHILGDNPQWGVVSEAFNILARYESGCDDRRDAKRRRILIPMILAEIRRRQRRAEVKSNVKALLRIRTARCRNITEVR